MENKKVLGKSLQELLKENKKDKIKGFNLKSEYLLFETPQKEKVEKLDC